MDSYVSRNESAVDEVPLGCSPSGEYAGGRWIKP